MTTIEAACALAESKGWLSLTPASFRREVLSRSQLQRFEAGQRIYSVGDEPGGIYCLITGGLRISIAPGEDGPYFAHFGQPGYWIGEGPILSGAPRHIGLAAGPPSEVLHLPLAALHAIVDADPGAWRHIGGLALSNLVMTVGIVNDLMMRSDEKRLTATLLRLGGCRYETPAEGGPAEINVSQDDIAAIANLARSTVGQMLRRFEAAGRIRIEYRCVVLLKPDAMRASLKAEGD